jgi:hypothetical protein
VQDAQLLAQACAHCKAGHQGPRLLGLTAGRQTQAGHANSGRK